MPTLTKKQIMAFNNFLSFKPLKWQLDAVWAFYKNKLDEFHIVAPRQNGKSQILLIIVLIELLVFKRKITFTSHRVKSCNDFFRKVKHELNYCKWFKKRVLRVVNSVGSQSIEMKSGAKIEFIARSKDGGIGDSNDVIIFDEFQMLNEKQMSAIFPTLAARIDSITIFAGTSPRVADEDDLYRKQRELHFGTIKWLEYGLGAKYSFDEMKKQQLFLDKKLLKETNPSFNLMIPYKNIEREFGKMDELDYAIQRLGLLHDRGQKLIFNENAINKVLIDSEEAKKYKGKFVLGIKFGLKHHAAVIGTQKDGVTYLQVLDKRENGKGFEWLAEFILKNKNCIGVMVDGLYAKTFGPMVAKKFYKTYKICGAREFIAAEHMLEQEIMVAKLQIANQSSIKQELQNVIWIEKAEYSKFGTVDEDSDVVVAEALAVANHLVKERRW